MATTAQLKVKIATEGAAKASDDLNKVEGATEGLGNAGKKTGGTLSKMIPTSAALKGGIAALGVAVAAASVKMVKMGISAAESIDAMNKQTQQLGLTVEQLTGLRFAADRAGVTNDELNVGMRQFARTARDASIGIGVAKDTYKALGIEVTKADGSLKSSDTILLDVADAFSTMSNGAAKTAAAMDLFGRSGVKMIPMLNEGQVGIDELRTKADELGIVLSTDMADSATQFVDSMTNMKAAMSGVAIQAIETSDAFGTMDDAIIVLDGSFQFVSDNADMFMAAINGLIPQVGALVNSLSLAKGALAFLADRFRDSDEASTDAEGSLDGFGESSDKVADTLDKRATPAVKKATDQTNLYAEANRQALIQQIEFDKQLEISTGNVDRFVAAARGNLEFLQALSGEVTQLSQTTSDEIDTSVETIRQTAQTATDEITPVVQSTTGLMGSMFDAVSAGADNSTKRALNFAKTMVGIIAQLIVSRAAQSAAGQTASVAEAATTATSMGIITAAASPAAATTSIATFGGSAAAGVAAFLAALGGIIGAISAISVADAGILPDPRKLSGAVRGGHSLTLRRNDEAVIDRVGTSELSKLLERSRRNDDVRRFQRPQRQEMRLQVTIPAIELERETVVDLVAPVLEDMSRTGEFVLA